MVFILWCVWTENQLYSFIQSLDRLEMRNFESKLGIKHMEINFKIWFRFVTVTFLTTTINSSIKYWHLLAYVCSFICLLAPSRRLSVPSSLVTTAIDKCSTICYTSEGLNKNHVAVPTQVGTCLTFDLCSVTDDGIFRTAKTRRPTHNNEFISYIHVHVCAVTRPALVVLLAWLLSAGPPFWRPVRCSNSEPRA